MNETELLALVKAYKESHTATNEAERRMTGSDPGAMLDAMDAFSVAHEAEFRASQRLLKFIQGS